MGSIGHNVKKRKKTELKRAMFKLPLFKAAGGLASRR